MKAVILAGGFGTRLAEYTDSVPKPMVQIGDRPILCHIMEWYASFGVSEFVLALGYKASVFKDYFLNYGILNSDFEVDLSSGQVTLIEDRRPKWKVTLVDTGLHTMTGGRLRRLKEVIGDETFMVTYGDGLSNIDINALVSFHQENKKLVTVTAVRPSARFGELTLDGSIVKKFAEKQQTNEGWVNGGFFVMEPSFLDFINGDDCVLEQEPLEQAALTNELAAFKHTGYWQCMDTKRDRDHLESVWNSPDCPWQAEKVNR